MKVVFVHPCHPNQFTQIAHHLAGREGWECSLLVNEGFTEQIRKEDPPIAYYGFREEATPASGSYYTQSLEESARRGKAVVEALAHLKASVGLDLVVGHASFGTTFFVRDLLKIPVVSYVELPGYFPVYCREEFPAQYPQALIDIALRALIHYSVLQSDLCIVPSWHAQRLFPQELQHKVRVQIEGFSLPDPVKDRAVLRRDLGINSSVPIVGFAARTLEAVRGFDIFVKVAKKIREARDDVQFLVVGDEGTIYGNEAMYLGGKSFKQHVLEKEGLNGEAFLFKHFLPHDQFVRHIQAMDVVLFPLFEGAASWALFEAMATGVPILASQRCFIPEVIIHGWEGYLFDVLDVEGFSRAALEILERPDVFEYIGLNARRKISQKFSLGKAVEGYAAILSEAVKINRNSSVDRGNPASPPPLGSLCLG